MSVACYLADCSQQYVKQSLCSGPVSAAGTDVMELQEFYEYMEQHRATAVDAAVQRYCSLTPVLGKVSNKGRTAVPQPHHCKGGCLWEAATIMMLRHTQENPCCQPCPKLQSATLHDVLLMPPG
jgi:hypothetical protein